MGKPRPFAGWVWVAAMAAACSFGDIDLRGRGCPCLDGWTCGPDGVCKPAGDDASRLDSGAGEAGIQDASARDSDLDSGPLDSGPSDAGSQDAANTDAGTPPSACGGTLESRLFCDGFDVPSLFPWSTSTSGLAEVRYSTARVYRGEGSLQAEVFSGSARNTNAGVLIPGTVSSGSLFGRAYVYLPSGQSFEYLQFFMFTEDRPPYGAVDLALTAGPNFEVQSRVASGVQETRESTTVLPTDRWLCLQMAIDVSPTSGSVQVFVDGTPLVALLDVPTLPAAGFEALAVGVNFASPGQAAANLFLDEVAFDLASIPCDP